MRYETRNKIMIIVVLLSIMGITIGFAAFTANLTISSSATVNPNASSFKVVFSNKSNSIDTSDVTPTLTPTTLSANQGIIDNTTNPTITNLNVNFTEPGQKAVYSFYVYNAGEYTAYLNSITFKTGTLSSHKTCTAGSGTTASLVTAACEDIKLTVKVGDLSVTQTTLGITGNTLSPKEGKQVTVTIEYLSGGDRADGPFSITFGDISLFYATITGQNEEIENNQFVLSNDVDGDGVADIGDEVTLGSESFYVVPDHENAGSNTISLMAKYNLNVGNDTVAGTVGLQNPQAVGSAWDESENPTNCNFDIEEYLTKFESAFGGSPDEFIEMNSWAGCAGTVEFDSVAEFFETYTTYWAGASAGTFVYNNQATIYNYVSAYETKLKSMGGSNTLVATLPSYQQLVSLGCSPDDNMCTSAPSWVYSTSYWSGSANGNIGVWYVYSNDYFSNDDAFFRAFDLGVRPVIIISESEL